MKVYSIAPTTHDQGLPKGQSRTLALPSCDVPEAMILPHTLPFKGCSARCTPDGAGWPDDETAFSGEAHKRWLLVLRWPAARTIGQLQAPLNLYCYLEALPQRLEALGRRA